jgi:predicted permease
MIRDLRYAVRSLAKAPGFAAAAIATLALGIGANSAIFSVVNAVLLKPLPYKDANQLVMIYTTRPGDGRDFVSQPDLDDWRTQSGTMSGIASLVPQSVNLTGGDQPERVIGSFVSANYFDVLEVRAALGRTFASGEDLEGASPVVILGDGIWHDRFGGDVGILGRSLILNGEPYKVAGVLPAGFIDSPWGVDLYLPARKYTNYKFDRAYAMGAVIGRMRPGVSVRETQTEMSGIAARLAAEYPATNRDRGALVVPLKEVVISDLRPVVTGLAWAVGFVLLIGCANVAGLFASRMIARERERAIRVALGASGGQLVSHVMGEAVVLATAGGILGCLLAVWCVRAMATVNSLSKVVAYYLPPGMTVKLDPAVVWFTFAATIATALLIAAIPAWQSSRTRLVREGRGAGAGSARNRVRSILVVSEVALALVLLVGAGLMMKSLVELNRARPGFDTRNLITFEYRLPPAKYKTDASRVEFHHRVIEKIREIPGVVDASSVRAVPLGGNGERDAFYPADRPAPPAAEQRQALFGAVDPYFFSTMRIPVLRGRVFNDHDTAGAPVVAVINRTLAGRFYADRDPIGRAVRIPSLHMTAEIVGVVGDVKQFRLEEPDEPEIYGVLDQNPFVFTSVAVRVAGDPSSMMNSIRRAVWAVDKDQPMWKMTTSDAKIATLSSGRELVTGLIGSYAGLALLLASVGIFGVVSYSVRQRTAEIGVRIALGARGGDIAGMVLRQGMAMTAVGVAIGGGAAAWVSGYLKSQLYAVSPLDGWVYGTVAVVLGVVAMGACLIPAVRAARVDPVVALRQE